MLWALMDRHDRVLLSSPGFPPLDSASLSARPDGRVTLEHVMDNAGAIQLAAVAHISAARDWALPDAMREGLARPDVRYVALSVAPMFSQDAVGDACAILGLTALQTRLVTALIRSGDLHEAAKTAGITYATARETVALAMQRAGVSRRPALIENVLSLSFGVLPAATDIGLLLRDIWGLSLRQARLAMAVAQGASREWALSPWAR